MYFYVFNDREMADTIMRATGEPYMVFGREDGEAFSFKRTEKVLVAYKAIKQTRKLLAK